TLFRSRRRAPTVRRRARRGGRDAEPAAGLALVPLLIGGRLHARALGLVRAHRGRRACGIARARARAPARTTGKRLQLRERAVEAIHVDGAGDPRDGAGVLVLPE